jgi:type IV secretory pathway TrbL component
MKKHLALLSALALCACGSDAPPAKPAVKASAPMQQKVEPAPQAAPAPAVQPVAPAQHAANANPNNLLAARVRKALDDGALQAAGIDVTAASGVVSLFGTVPSNDEKTRAARLATKVEGVKSVDNRLVVVRGS